MAIVVLMLRVGGQNNKYCNEGGRYFGTKLAEDLFFVDNYFCHGEAFFYVSHSYIDPFFTSGMLWTGYIVAVGWVVWLLGSKGIVRVPRMVGYWGAVLVAYIVVAWCNGSFSVQHFSFFVSVVWVDVVVCSGGKGYEWYWCLYMYCKHRGGGSIVGDWSMDGVGERI